MISIGADTETTGTQWQHGAECFNACLAAQEPFPGSTPSDSWHYLKLLYSVDPKTRLLKRNSKFDDNVDQLRTVFHSDDTHFVFHNMKFDLLSLATVDVFSSRDQLIEFALNKCRDSIHLSHLVYSLREHALKPLASSVSGIPNDDELDLKECVQQQEKVAEQYGWNHYPHNLPYPMKQPNGGWWKINMWLPHTMAEYKKKPLEHHWWHVCSKYCAFDAKRTLCVELDLPIDEELRDGIKRSRRIQHHATVALLEGELNGVAINYTGLIEEVKRLEQIQEEWYHRIRREVDRYVPYFNPGSSAQMKEHCFRRLDLPITQYTKKGLPSTGKLWLAEMISLADAGDKKLQQHTNFLYAVYMWKRIKTAVTYLKSYIEKAVQWTSPSLFSRFSSPATSSIFLPTWYDQVINASSPALTVSNPNMTSVSETSNIVSETSHELAMLGQQTSTVSVDVSAVSRTILPYMNNVSPIVSVSSNKKQNTSLPNITQTSNVELTPLLVSSPISTPKSIQASILVSQTSAISSDHIPTTSSNSTARSPKSKSTLHPITTASICSNNIPSPLVQKLHRPSPRKHPQSSDSNGCSLFSIAWLHPNHNVTGTKTTRLSCKNPNTTQIGTGKDALSEKSPLKRLVRDLALNPRKFFIPDPESVLLSIDYSQIQLALFAQLSGEEGMVRALLSGEDLHSYTARVIYNLPEGATPDKGQRAVGKNVNFGFIFGAGEAKMRSSTAGVRGLKRILSARFPDATKFMSENMADAKGRGYVLTPGGYPLYVPEEQPYAATNYIIQGAEGEIVKAAMAICAKHLRALPKVHHASHSSVVLNEMSDSKSSTPRPVSSSDRTVPAASTQFPTLFSNGPSASGTPGPSLIMQIHDELLFRVPLTHLSQIPVLISLVKSAGDLFGFHLDAEGTIGVYNWGEGIKCTDRILRKLETLPVGHRVPQSTLMGILNSSTTSA